MDDAITRITLGALVADAYSLGAHWIYDDQQLASLDVDWQTLNDPRAHWHPNRKAGQFTHYGDQLVLIYEYALAQKHFHLGGYMKKWFFHMRCYDGYMDTATNNTLDNMRAHNALPCGFGSEDLSVAGRIAPLLHLSSDEETLLKNVDLFTRATHFTAVTRDCSRFCAQLLWRLWRGKRLDDAMAEILPTASDWMCSVVETAKAHLELAPGDAIRAFGRDCNARKGMPGAMYLLLRYKDDYRTAMIENAKAGGDSASRAMVAGMLMVAAYGVRIVPEEWINRLAYRI